MLPNSKMNSGAGLVGPGGEVSVELAGEDAVEREDRIGDQRLSLGTCTVAGGEGAC
jgi:hypothetical protein